MESPAPSGPRSFLDFPPEIRNQIYSAVFEAPATPEAAIPFRYSCKQREDGTKYYKFNPEITNFSLPNAALLLTCKQINTEARSFASALLASRLLCKIDLGINLKTGREFGRLDKLEAQSHVYTPRFQQAVKQSQGTGNKPVMQSVTPPYVVFKCWVRLPKSFVQFLKAHECHQLVTMAFIWSDGRPNCYYARGDISFGHDHFTTINAQLKLWGTIKLPVVTARNLWIEHRERHERWRDEVGSSLDMRWDLDTEEDEAEMMEGVVTG